MGEGVGVGEEVGEGKRVKAGVGVGVGQGQELNRKKERQIEWESERKNNGKQTVRAADGHTACGRVPLSTQSSRSLEEVYRDPTLSKNSSTSSRSDDNLDCYSFPNL